MRHDAAGVFSGGIMARWNFRGSLWDESLGILRWVLLRQRAFRAGLSIYAVLEFLAALEKRQFFGLDLHLLAGLGVAAGVAAVFLDKKRAQAPDFYTVALCQRMADGIKKNIYRFSGFRSGNPGFLAQCCNQFE